MKFMHPKKIPVQLLCFLLVLFLAFSPAGGVLSNTAVYAQTSETSASSAAVDMTDVSLDTESISLYVSEDYYGSSDTTIRILSSYSFDEDDKYTSVSVKSSSKKVKVYWSLADNVFSLSFYGTGTAKLTITLNNKVFTVPVSLVSISASTDAVLLYPGKTKTVSVKGTDSSAQIKWSSSNKKVASVSGSGKITAKKVGNAIITATIDDVIKVGCVVSVTTKKKVQGINKAIKIYESSSYSQARRMKTGYYDCSSLVWRSFKPYGYYFGSKKTAPVAASIAYYLNNKGKLKGSYSFKDTQNMVMRAGDLLFKTGSGNGRYKGIDHVEIFTGYALAYYDEDGEPVVTTTWATRADGYADSGDLYARF